MAERGTFVWFELVTDDLGAARDFYQDVVGWTTRDSGLPDMTYLLCHADGIPVAGLMETPPGASPDRCDPFWLGYVAVPDVDACTAAAETLGARIQAPPTDIAGVGHFSVVRDPQGAIIVPFKGAGTPPPAVPPGTVGHGGWHELMTGDWEAAFAFYAALFGWTKGDAIDMGPMGTYQLFAVDGVPIGGMMNVPPGCAPTWRYYFVVDGIDAAATRVAAAGGAVTQGPHPVPGGAWILHGRDPQGVFFALTSGAK